MTVISIKNDSTSSLLDVWQQHILQAQADKAAAQAAQSAQSSDDSSNGGQTASVGNVDQNMIAMIRAASDGAKQIGQGLGAKIDKAAQGGGGASSAGGTDSSGGIVEQTLQKLKQQLAKINSQIQALQANDTMDPQEKMQQLQVLSASALTIQAQIVALMNNSQSTGTQVNTTA